jgi:hypothetical protein
MKSTAIHAWLSRTNKFWFSLFVATTAFLLYTSVYGFRKTFSVATFDDMYYLGISVKVWLVTSQVLGYAASKFIGIKIVSEMRSRSRFKSILLLIGVAGISWLLFAITPLPFNIVFLFTNGLPLGMIWGLIFSYLEGRQTTDLLGAGLSVSFIFSSGFTKSVGAYLLQLGISETWMPLAACCVFILPLLLFLWLLDQVPPPDSTDQLLRTKREPMLAADRKAFLREFGPGLITLIIAYMMLTAFRDFRDNFSAEIWTALGYGGSPEIFTTTEIPVSLVVLTAIGSLMFIKNNQLALIVNHYIIIFGLLLIGVSTWMFTQNMLSPVLWMMLVGMGLYLGYVPFNSIFFERLIASFQYVGTVGFVMYLADAFGYLGSVAVMLFKEFGFSRSSWLSFMVTSGYVLSIAGSLLIITSLVYFDRKSAAMSSVRLRGDYE